jgi:peptidoglycan/LPS O-acetylase OafA/YrhL
LRGAAPDARLARRLRCRDDQRGGTPRAQTASRLVTEAGPQSPTDVAVVEGLTGELIHRRLWIDVARGLAALMVLVSHYLLFAGYWTQNNLTHKYLAGAIDQNLLGQGGVVLFFTISGYLIGRPYVRALSLGQALPRFGPYALRRAARILPAYWIALLGAFLLYAPSGLIRPSLGRLVVHALLLQSYLTNQNRDFPLLGVAWTLVIEVSFYVSVPVAAAVLRRFIGPRLTPVRLGLIVAAAGTVSLVYALWSCSVHTFGTPRSTLYLDNLLGYGFLFCPGLLLAIVEQSPPRRRCNCRLRAGVAAVGLLAALAFCYAESQTLYELRYAALALAAGAGFSLALAATRHPGWVARATAALGVVSYGTYLWHLTLDQLFQHQELISHVHGLLSHLGVDLRISSDLGRVLIWGAAPVFGLAVTLPLAVASWRLIEKPVIDWAAVRTAIRQPESACPR